MKEDRVSLAVLPPLTEVLVLGLDLGTYLELVLLRLSSRAGVEEINCQNLRDQIC